MPLIQLIVLAVVQGVTEFLPVSSSAHLILAPLLVESWSDQGPLIDVAAHVGSLLAVLLYFRGESWRLACGLYDVCAFRATPDRRLFLLVAVASIPVLAVGAGLAVTGAVDALRSPYLIATTSIVFGVLLWHADRRPTSREGLDRIGWREAMWIGAAQTLALAPGASRSGVTMTMARYLGWSRPEAARFSMLLAIPTISAFGVLATVKLVTDGAQAEMSAAAIVAVLSFVAALLTIAVFMRVTRSLDFTPFVIYRIGLGIALFAFAGQLPGAS
ncbi:MAG: undecaprenyl-diphosphate phosphatase [Parvularculaceae bacterium]